MNTNSLQGLPGLNCKPSGKASDVYAAVIPHGRLIFRSLCLAQDLDTIYSWTRQVYSRRFWQMDGYSRQEWQEIYLSILQNPHAHSFVAFLNDRPAAQIDIYQVLIDELSLHVQASFHDCGIHLLLQPPKQSQKNLSIYLLRAFITYFFSFDAAARLYAEPDEKNAMANLLAKRAGFSFLKKIQLSYKTANLYSLTKQQFHATNKIF
jgi:RimJ/RimL family protein N-acetyltransferase